MMISSKELKTYLENLKPKILNLRNSEKISGNPIPNCEEGHIDFILSMILKDISGWEVRQQFECPDLPYAIGCDSEKCLLVYCTENLYRFVDKFEDLQKEDKDISIIDIGKLWLEVKKFLREGKFKRQ